MPPARHFRLFSATLLDWLFALGLGGMSSLYRAHSLTLWENLALPTLLLPVGLYLFMVFVGQSPGQWMHGLARVHSRTGERPYRIYDFFFDSEWRDVPNLPLPGLALHFALPIALSILVLGTFHRVASNDPSMRAWTTTTLPIFAPAPLADGKANPDWKVLPFYYSTGAWPARFEGKDILYSLPYEKGPPERFVGKIGILWNLPEAKITLVGPLTLKEPDTVANLQDCFTKNYGCITARRSIIARQLKPFFDQARLEIGNWFTVENPALDPAARAQGLYLQGPSLDGTRIFEAYYLVNSKMAIQGIVLERSDGAIGKSASERLRQVVGSIRMDTDLAAPAAWVNAQLAKVRLRPGLPLGALLDAQGILLSKVSVDPKVFDSFYHLGGLGMMLYTEAKKTGELELAAASKTLVQSVFRFSQDVSQNRQADAKKLQELELFKAQVERP